MSLFGEIEKTKHNTIENIGDYLADNFAKIEGLQYEWNSLITSNPLLFEDIDYLKVKQFVKNEASEFEIEAFKKGEIRELYSTFENMLMCNLQHYDRIMSFCTMVFMHYIRLSESEITTQYLEELPYALEMSPTQIWCAALTNSSSTFTELNYGWNFENQNIDLIDIANGKSVLENNWVNLYNNIIFSRFVEYCSIRTNVEGFRPAFLADKTSNKKLSQVCQKFIKTTAAVSEDSLNTITNYYDEINQVNNNLYLALHKSMMRLFSNDATQFAIYVFPKEFYIKTVKFSMKVYKDDVGRISKDYLSNSYECFAAEEYLFDSIKAQIEWAKYKVPIKFDFERTILKNILNQMLTENFRTTVCVKRMNEYGTISKIKFSGMFDKVNIEEEFMFNNNCIMRTRLCMSKENAAKYVIDKGYAIFGTVEETYKIVDNLSQNSIVNHYAKYCTPILKHMGFVIAEHVLYKNDINAFLTTGKINPTKINNDNIKYTNIKSFINASKLMHVIGEINNGITDKKQTYWKLIEA